MEIRPWEIVSNELDIEKRFSRDALFMTGNGRFGIRGFFEEDTTGIGGLGGIYMAGVFGKGDANVCSGPSRELCNLPNILRLEISVDGSSITPLSSNIQNFSQILALNTGEYTRTYNWTKEKTSLHCSFQRFTSLSNLNEVWQRLALKCNGEPIKIVIKAVIDTDIKNLNLVSSEPLPIQPGRNHIASRNIKSADQIQVSLDNPDTTTISMAQKMKLCVNEKEIEGKQVIDKMSAGYQWQLVLSTGDILTLDKAVCVCADFEGEYVEVIQGEFSSRTVDYLSELEKHSLCWHDRWETSDFIVDASDVIQGALRYNIFQLMAACPLHSDKVSIGARGLSGEMYEGCVFWDNEIFQLPFFCWSDPCSARRLLGFRYHTLPSAKERAYELWFDGAMYPWQASERGMEQTISEGGAFYAIHIVADIAFAIGKYIKISGDESFLLSGGAEILLETSRFWLSRCDYSNFDGKYHILSVRGPNEYDVFVDDNAYTNTMAVQNLKLASWALSTMKQKWPQQLEDLLNRLHFTEDESKKMIEVSDNIAILYTNNGQLLLEDDRYHLRRPLNLSRAKPTRKRIIDSTLPYEALPLYQVTKQADVVLLMNLIPELFTKSQKEVAYNYYEPRTAHDSSLSYSPHGWMAAVLGKMDEAYSYFEKSLLLDVEDRQMNSISGIHYANFGGTWQVAFSGFAGITEQDGIMCISPNLPKQWNGFAVKCWFHKSKVSVSLKDSKINVELLQVDHEAVIPLLINGSKYQISKKHPIISVQMK